jgi:transposase
MVWLNRFFAASGDVLPGTRTSAAGPWIASAYQRAVSPAGVTPDAAGLLKYYHPIEDQWAHVYRYYVLPSGRYDLLWQNLAQSAHLYPDRPGEAENPRLKNLRALRRHELPAQGGLDVVLDRIKSIAPPLVLYSGRLDPKTAAAEPAPPGRTWEVIVAKHPEQSLIERNRTLQRQLAYRQMAHSLLRRFAFPEELEKFRQALGSAHTITLKLVENQTQVALPGDYDSPDHIDLAHPESHEVLSLDLPERLRVFDQGAIVLQWESLPYFYQHRLLLVAQSATTVSPAIDVIQRDFEYRSPDPRAELEGVALADGGRRLLARIRLDSYWDCLPESAQARWSIEEPKAADGAARKLASLPDTAVAYQIVFERDGGVIEAQAELTFDAGPTPAYRARQIAKKFTVAVGGIVPPAPPAAGATAQNPFQLETRLETGSAFTLKQPQERTLSFTGDFTLGARNRELLSIADAPFKPAVDAAPEVIHRHLKRWAVACKVSYCWLDRKREQASLLAFTANSSGLREINHREFALLAEVASEDDPPVGLLKESRDVLERETGVSNRLVSEAVASPGLLAQARGLLEQERSRLIQQQANAQASQQERDALRAQQTAVEELLQILASARGHVTSRIGETGLLAAKSRRLDRLMSLTLNERGILRRESDLLTSAQTHVQQALALLRQEPDILRRIQERPDLLLQSPELAGQARERLTAMLDALRAAQGEMEQLKQRSAEKLALADQLQEVFDELRIMQPDSREAASEALKTLNGFLERPQTLPAAKALVEQSRDLLRDDLNAPQKVPDLLDRVRKLRQAATESPPLLARAESLLSGPLELAQLKLAFVELLRANPERWARMLKKLDFFNPSGQIWLICREDLNPVERDELRNAFPAQADRTELSALFLDLDDRQTLDRFLGEWRAEQAISTRHAFPASRTWDDRIEFTAPEACVLALDGALSQTEEDELRGLAEAADVSFATAARQLIDRGAAGKTTIAEAGLGLEQIVELADRDRAVAPTSQDRNLTWRGAISDEQRRTIGRWAQIPMHGATFQALLDAIDRKALVFSDDSARETRPSEVESLIRDLDGRLSVNAESLTATWRGLLLNPEEEAILTALGARTDVSPTLRQAIQSMLDDLLRPGASPQSEVSVAAPADWRPRPRAADLSAGLRSKLLIGNGRIRFYGWMSAAEARSLRQGRDKPDRNAIRRLFDASMRAGMDGGHLSIQSRRGSADVRKKEMSGVDLDQAG